jgi:two-component system cell cycle sensor histidine kinase/response regulator CckA
MTTLRQDAGEGWKLRALECASEGVVITDALEKENPIIYVNQGFRAMTGYTNEDVLGKNCRFMRGDGTESSVTQNIRDSLRDGVPFAAEILNYRKNGVPFWNRLHISPVRDDSGRITHFVGIQLDVTPLKDAEKQLEAARDRLAVAARFSAVGEMTAGAAHEINNPISVIYHKARQALRMLNTKAREEMDDASWDSLRASLVSIESMGMRVGKIVRDMQVFTAASGQVQMEELPLANLLNGVLTLFTERMEAQKVLVSMAIEDELKVLANGIQVEQILSNLVQNALDAMAGEASQTLSIVAAKEGAGVAIRVRDAAPLISNDVAEKIFMPFFTTKDVGKGTGLGLSIARSFAQCNGGNLELIRDETGNVFVLSLLWTAGIPK